jgi:hypothetical protein
MSFVIPTMPFVRQPQFAARLRGIGLTKGLVFAGYPVGTGFYDALSGQISTPSANWAARNTIDGNLALSQEVRTTQLSFPVYSTGLDRIAGAYSIFLEASLFVNASEFAIVRSIEPNVTGDGLGINLDDTSVINDGFLNWLNNGRRTNSNSGALGTNSEQFRHRLMVTGDGTTAKYFAKGKLDKSVADATLPNANTSRQTFLSYGTGGAASLILAWNRVVSLEEFQQLYFNPWQVFQSPSRYLIKAPAAGGGGAQSITLNGYVAKGIYGAAAVAPGAVNVSLNSFVAQGIYGALTANSTYPIILNPVVAQALFGSMVVAPGAVDISPASVIGQIIFGAFSAAQGSTQDIQPSSVVGQGVFGAFTLVPGAVNVALGNLTAQGVEGSFTVAPGSVNLTLTAAVAQGILGPIVLSYVITQNGIMAQASLGGIALAVGAVTVSPGAIVAQTEFGPLVVSFQGQTQLVLQSRIHVHTDVLVG